MPDKHQHRANHATQEERLPAPLLPGYIKPDERSFAELIDYYRVFASLIKHADVETRDQFLAPGRAPVQPVNEGQVRRYEQNWTAFFEHDVSLLLAQIAVIDLHEEKFEVIRIIRTYRSNDVDARKIIVEKIIEKARRLDGWFKHADRLSTRATHRSGVEHNLRATLATVIENDLSGYFVSLKNHLAGHNDSEAGYEKSWSAVWFSKASQRSRLSEDLDHILESFHNTTSQLSQLAHAYLSESLTNKSNHQPHVALLLVFSRLMQHAQTHLNTMTERHLMYFYQDVLQMHPRNGESDSTFVSLVLADHVHNPLHLPSSTKFAAGTDEAGRELTYVSTESLTIHPAKLDVIKTLYAHREGLRSGLGFSSHLSRPITRIYAVPFANSADGKGADLPDPETGWATFGEDIFASNPMHDSDLHAQLGLVIASKLFLLREGQREVIITFTFENESPLKGYKDGLQEALIRSAEEDKNEAYLVEAFNVWLSSNAGWVSVPEYKLRIPDAPATTHKPGGQVKEQDRQLELSFMLNPDMPPVVHNDELAATYGTGDAPLFKLAFNPEARLYAYSYFQDVKLESVDVAVKVSGLRTLFPQNENGLLDIGQPFPIFGAMPVRGSYLHFGNIELFQKELTAFKLNIEWHDLPRSVVDPTAVGNPENAGGEHNQLVESFPAYYKGYGLDFNNEVFQMSLSVRSGRDWKFLSPAEHVEREAGETTSFSLFNERGNTLQPISAWAFNIGQSPLSYVSQFAGNLVEPLIYDPQNVQDLFRLRLTAPAYAFGHQVFQSAFARAATANVERASYNMTHAKGIGRGKIKPAVMEPLPNPPFVPVARGFYVDYEAKRRLQLRPTEDKKPYEIPPDHLIIQHPFGRRTFNLGDATLFPVIEHLGHLMLGFSGLKRRQVLTLLFNLKNRFVDEVDLNGEIDHNKTRGNPVEWHYLSNNEWKPFEKAAIVDDTTFGLITSGILKLMIPDDITTDNSVMPSGKSWIRATARTPEQFVGNIITIYPNAVLVTREEGTPEPPEGVLPAFAITDLVVKDAGIKQVMQPVPSSESRRAETENAYLTRVSERLRHKQRAIQPWDFERLVLGAFPQIAQVKCVTHNLLPAHQKKRVLPGEVMVVVFPRLEAGAIPKQPLVPEHLLDEIARYLCQFVSPLVARIRVRNPVYEPLTVKARIKFNKERDTGSVVERLKEDLIKYVAPWQLDATQAVDFCGEGFSEDKIRAYFESLDYINEQDAISRFSMTHVYADDVIDAAGLKGVFESLGYPTFSRIIHLFNDPCHFTPPMLDVRAFGAALKREGLSDAAIKKVVEIIQAEIRNDVSPRSLLIGELAKRGYDLITRMADCFLEYIYGDELVDIDELLERLKWIRKSDANVINDMADIVEASKHWLISEELLQLLLDTAGFQNYVEIARLYALYIQPATFKEEGLLLATLRTEQFVESGDQQRELAVIHPFLKSTVHLINAITRKKGIDREIIALIITCLNNKTRFLEENTERNQVDELALLFATYLNRETLIVNDLVLASLQEKGLSKEFAGLLFSKVAAVPGAIRHLFDEDYHLIDTAHLEETGRLKAIIPFKPWSIIIPDEARPIILLDEMTNETPEKVSIGNLRVGADFIVTRERRTIPAIYEMHSRPLHNAKKSYVLKIKLPAKPPGQSEMPTE